MIKIFNQNEGIKKEITVVGHAKDEKVCAAVSGLFVALAESAQKDGSLDRYNQGQDAQRVTVYRTKNAKRFLQMFYVGVEAIAREYPEEVMVF